MGNVFANVLFQTANLFGQSVTAQTAVEQQNGPVRYRVLLLVRWRYRLVFRRAFEPKSAERDDENRDDDDH